jgi:ribosomal-protein-alanine N-acetyltransferase
MIHKGTVTLETARLTLRRFTPDDAESMFRSVYGIPEVMRFLPWETHRSADETVAFLRGYIDAYHKRDFYAWAIAVQAENMPIGYLDTDVNENLSEIKMGYGIGKDRWRKGYMSEAVAAVIRFFFEQVKANRVAATHDPRNPSSGAVMRKCGMSYEGTLRQARHRKGEYSDRVQYAILAEDYNQGLNTTKEGRRAI